jgi:hypothetical protein
MEPQVSYVTAKFASWTTLSENDLHIKRSFYAIRTNTAQRRYPVATVSIALRTDEHVPSHTAFTLHYLSNLSGFCYRNTVTIPDDRRRKLVNHLPIRGHSSRSVSNLLTAQSSSTESYYWRNGIRLYADEVGSQTFVVTLWPETGHEFGVSSINAVILKLALSIFWPVSFHNFLEGSKPW